MKLLDKKDKLTLANKGNSMSHYSLCEMIQMQRARKFEKPCIIIDPKGQFKVEGYKKRVINLDQDTIKFDTK